MYPTPRYEDTAGSVADVTQGARTAPNSDTSSLGSWEHVDVGVEGDAGDRFSGSGSSEGGGGGVVAEGVPPDSMVVSFPNEDDEDGEESGWGPGDEVRVLEEKRKAQEVVEARRRREREEEESVRGMEEAARRAGEAAREDEMLCVRGACLPGLVFLTHEVSRWRWCGGGGAAAVVRNFICRALQEVRSRLFCHELASHRHFVERFSTWCPRATSCDKIMKVCKICWSPADSVSACVTITCLNSMRTCAYAYLLM